MHRLGVFGGSFNPPHRGHEALVESILERDLVAEIWIIPVFQHPFGKPLAPFADRLEMCRLAFTRFGDRVQVSTIERDLGGASYTVRTLEELARRSTSPLALILGADAIRDQDSWKDFARVQELAELIVVPRHGEPPPAGAQVPAPPPVSSTEIRDRLARGELVTDLVSPEVAAYAAKTGLYS